jgi:hypothetical protein
MMAVDDQGVFVFAEDGVEFRPTAAEAATCVEAVDVESGVYKAFISLDGERLLPRPVDETSVGLERSGDRDKAHLIELLERERTARHTFTSDRPTRCSSLTNYWLVTGKHDGPSGPAGLTADFMAKARPASTQPEHARIWPRTGNSLNCRIE